jgi:hypothetical protein
MENANSTTNQKIKGQFVDREVICLFSYPMEACLKAGVIHNDREMPQFEDLENWESYPEYFGAYAKFSGGTAGERQEEIERLEELFEEWEEKDPEVSEAIRAEIEELERLETEPQEIYEWWIVSDYLFEKLREHGEPVIEWQNLYIWGRTTSGQAILLDKVISDICEEMEILEGQKSSWAEKQTA